MPMDVDKMQKKLAKWSQDHDFRFDDIYNLLYDENWLRRAFRSVKSNSGSRTAGVDYQTISDFEERLSDNLDDLQSKLKSTEYTPQPVRRVTIPKGGGEERALGIPTIQDRIVQEAVRMVLEPIYETDFSDASYGFRPNRSTHDAIMDVHQNIMPAGNFKPWVLDLEIKGYFDNVDHGTLGKILQDRITDRKILKLVWKILKSGIMDEGKYQQSMIGTPQGGIISPLLANIYLNELDQWVKDWTNLSKREGTQRRNSGKGTWRYVRYADDFLLLTNGRKEYAETMMERVEDFLQEELKLDLNRDKSEITHAEDGLEFLGYYLKSKTDTGGTKRHIPKDAVHDIRTKIRKATDGPTDVSIRAKLKAINAVVTGWANYYKYATNAGQVFSKVQYFMGPRIVEWISNKMNTSKRKVWAKTDNEYPLDINGVRMTYLPDMRGKRRLSPHRHGHPYLSGNDQTTQDIPSTDPWLATAEQRTGWLDQRYKALDRDNYECQVCGSDLDLSDPVHHIRPYNAQSDTAANRLENLKSLCEPCHKRIESNKATT